MRTVLATVLLLCAAPAFAADTREPAHREVSFADLDLRQPAHVDRLERRVRLAAQRACGSGGPTVAHHRARFACVAGAVESADGAIQTAVANARTGGVQSASLRVPIAR